MIDLKPYGAFIEYSIRPTFEEVNRLIDRLEKQGFQFNNENVRSLLKYLSHIYLQSLIVNLVKTIITFLGLAFIAYKLL